MTFRTVLAAAIGLLLTVPLIAHHSVGTEFDVKNCRDFTGVLTKINWANPHAWFDMDIRDANGQVQSWSFQTFSTPTLKRAGTSRQEFLDNIGKEVWVRGCLARSGAAPALAPGAGCFTS